MKHSLNLTLSGYAYLHTISRVPDHAYAEVSVISDIFSVTQDELFLRVNLGDIPSQLLLFGDSLRSHSVLMKFTAKYQRFGSHYVNPNEDAEDSDIVTWQVDEFEVHECYIDGKRHDNLTTSTFAKAA